MLPSEWHNICLYNITLPEAPPKAFPRVELMMSILPDTPQYSSVPLLREEKTMQKEDDSADRIITTCEYCILPYSWCYIMNAKAKFNQKISWLFSFQYSFIWLMSGQNKIISNVNCPPAKHVSSPSSPLPTYLKNTKSCVEMSKIIGSN